MPIFHHPFWGYQLEYPQDWIHEPIGDTEAFAAIPEALQTDYDGPQSGHLLIHGEWNPTRRPVEDLWKSHIAKTASFLGAKKVRSAPWKMANSQGFETELVLSKKSPKRLWVGLLENEYTLLHLMVTHHKLERDAFEPIVSRVISSLEFDVTTADIELNNNGFPLPPGYRPIDPSILLTDIRAEEDWEAYDGTNTVDALQAFYLRESTQYGWQAQEYIPFPNTSHHNFARIHFQKDGRVIILAILPYAPDDQRKPNVGKIVIQHNR